MEEWEDIIKESYIVTDMINEMITAGFLESDSFRDYLCKVKIENLILYNCYVAEDEKIQIYNIYFNYLVRKSRSKELILKDKKLLRFLDDADKALLEDNYIYYWGLDRGTRTPTTKEERKFVEVCLGVRDPKTKYEKAYSNHIKNRENLILETFNQEKRKKQLSAEKKLEKRKKQLSAKRKYNRNKYKSKSKKCPRCEGCGLMPSSRSPCSNCGGIGYVQQT